MKKVLFLIIAFIFIQCSDQKTKLITKGKVGEITKITTEKELEDIYKNDSIVKIPKESIYVNEYAIYEKGGKHLLSVFPKIPEDTVSFIERIHIYSPKFITEKGVSTISTFSDIMANYSINKIDPTFTTAIIYIDELNGTFALDKKDLGLDEFDLNKISKDQIPDMAKIKYITIWFE
ncbi:MAG: hypothetical protein ABFR32_13140 [Bacteroidota bacterium]